MLIGPGVEGNDDTGISFNNYQEMAGSCIRGTTEERIKVSLHYQIGLLNIGLIFKRFIVSINTYSYFSHLVIVTIGNNGQPAQNVCSNKFCQDIYE